MDQEIQKWLNGEITDDQLKELIGESEALKYIQIVGEVDSWVPDQATSLFEPSQITNRPKGKVSTMRPVLNYAVAAVLLLTIISYMWVLLGDPTVSFSSAVGENRVVQLPDGVSKVTLSPNSEISWDEDAWDEALASKSSGEEAAPREVKLKGKALFQVEKGGPFSVESAMGLVEVLGTTFEVDDFDGGMNVICFEGKVAAKPKTARKRLIINDGEGYRYFKNKWEEKTVVSQALPDWVQNKTKFDNAPLVQVINTLEKLYGITIDKNDVNIDRRFTGAVPNDKLDVALEIIFTPYKIRYVKKEKNIILSQE